MVPYPLQAPRNTHQPQTGCVSETIDENKDEGITMKKKTALLILFGLLLVLLFLPALVCADNTGAGFQYFTKTEFANYAKEHPDLTVIDGTAEGPDLPKDASGKYIVPDGAITLGDDGEGSQNYIVPQSWVKVYRSGQNGLQVIPSPQNSGSSSDSRRSYTIADPSNSLLTGTAEDSRVFIVLDDNSYDYGMVHSVSGNTLTLKANSETDDTALTYISAIHMNFGGNSPFSVETEIKDQGKMTLIGVGSFGDYSIDGTLKIKGVFDGTFSPLVVDFTAAFFTEIDFYNGDYGFNVKTDNVDKEWVKELNPFSFTKYELCPGLLSIDLTPCLVFEARADAEATIKFKTTMGFSFKFHWSVFSGDDTVRNFVPLKPDLGASVDVEELKGTLFGGLKWGPGLSFCEGVFTVSLDYRAGVELSGFKNKVGIIEDGTKYHACTDGACWGISACLRLGPLAASGRFVGPVTKKTYWAGQLADLGGEIKFDPFFEAYRSGTFDTGGLGQCPHTAWRAIVHVVDSDDNPIKNAQVSYEKHTNGYKEHHTAKTNSDGYATIYIPYDKVSKEPSPDKVRIWADYVLGGKDFGQSLEYKPKPWTTQQEIKIDLRQVHITFADPPNTYPKSTNLPGEISYYLYDQKSVQIPDTIPERTACHFLYWSTSPEGKGEKINPGGYIQADHDTTLYPIYKALLMDSYSVVYNLNGGQSGPMTQTVDIDKDAVLSTEPAVWENHKFLGWSYTDTSAQAEFPVGKRNILKNEEHKRVIVLYAVWAFDPTNPPVKLTFDMNGGPEQQKPSDQWVRRNVWVPISRVVPVWNKLYTFSGWNEDKYASVGDYSPGDTIYMDESKTLYAIWVYNPAPEPYCITFADSGTGTAYDLPSPVYFSRDPGTLVRLPDQIPLKREKQFVGWNTKEDGSGDSYAPGASFAPGGDLTLYAQWKTLRNSFIVLYNANGGSSAPLAQEFYLDQIALLTSEPAVWTNHKFLGWALTVDAFEPDYPVGAQNVLRNPDGDPLVELYAVWAFSPVDMPLKIVYDMNGGPENRKPSVQHAAAGTHVVITHTVPTWDKQHTFRGWGLNPTDTEPFYQPGDTIVLIQDMKLYALWNVKYTIIQGNGSSWTSNRSHGLRFVADGNIDYFYHLQIDGTPVLRSRDYKLSSGSTIADLSRKLLIRAGKGVHTIRFVYKDGVAEGTFTVTKAVPDTGDTANFPLYAGLILLGLAGIGIPILRKRRKKT